MLHVSITNKNSDNYRNIISCLFNKIVLIPSIFKNENHFLQIANIEEGYFNLPISVDSLQKLQGMDLKKMVWDCLSITNSNNLIIRIKSKENIEEYVVDSMAIFPKIDPRINCFSLRYGLQIRYLQVENENKNIYNKSFYDNDVKIIDINPNVEQIIISPYFPQKCLKFNFKEYGINTKTIGSLPSFDPYKHKGHGITTSIYELPIEIDWERLYVGIEINKCVFSESYECISHASMDPGPDIHYESTNWHLKSLVAFSTKSDLIKFLSHYPSRECTYMDNHCLTPFSNDYQQLVFTFGTEAKIKPL